MRSLVSNLAVITGVAFLLFLAVGFFSPQPITRGGENCTCTYSPGTTGQVVSTGSPSCIPPGGLTVGSQLTVYTSSSGQCLRIPDCTEEEITCVATGRIDGWTNSLNCKVSIVVGTRVMAAAYDWVSHEFDEELECGHERVYSICVGSVPIIQHTNECLDCPL